MDWSQSKVFLVRFSYINVSQEGVATQLRCGEVFDNDVVANISQDVPLKESR